MPAPTPLRPTSEANENKIVSEFQSELVQLAAALHGDHIMHLESDSEEKSQKMTVKEADEYVNRVMTKFYEANEKAIRSNADESSILDIICQP